LTLDEERFEEEEEEGQPIQYKITSSPNDFNVNTLFDFIETGTMTIPGFQRNYVWDKRRASKLIESIIMGLPIPQLFFYEKADDEFLVIDGQQRLMTIYYFIKERFPKYEKRAELRRLIDEKGTVPPSVLADDNYFTDFELDLGPEHEKAGNRLSKRTLTTLDKPDQRTFKLKPIRCIFIKQYSPEGDAAIYEIFHRLNTGGVNLTAQEIRAALHQSPFYVMIARANVDPRWRRFVSPYPDTRMKDMEALLRGFAVLIDADNYQGSMVRFLNNFSKKAKEFDSEYVTYLERLFQTFLQKCAHLSENIFDLQTGRFSTSTYEAIFAAACLTAHQKRDFKVKSIDEKKIIELKSDEGFMKASRYRTAASENVIMRIKKASEYLAS
jgi:uncharacterized protein with ParB-like and HNH nuclease domain